MEKRSPLLLLPDDISLKILASLEVVDVCSFGSCSKSFRELCSSDCLWMSLCRDRWPHTTPESNSHFLGWRRFYIEKHDEMAGKVSSVIKAIEKCSASQSLEVGNYHKAIADLYAMELGFKDVVIFLFASKQNALLNLIGLHYLLCWIGIPADYVVEALWSCHISERQVCIKWWKLGRWLYGYRLRDESYSRKVSLIDLALAKEEEAFKVLQRGAIHEVLRVQISGSDTACIPWTLRNAYPRF